MHMRVPGVLNFDMTYEGSKKRVPPISSRKHFRKLIIFCLIRKGTRKRRSNRTGISFFRLSSLGHQQNRARAPNHKNIDRAEMSDHGLLVIVRNTIARVRYIKILSSLQAYYGQNCKLFMIPLSRNFQKNGLEQKGN